MARIIFGIIFVLGAIFLGMMAAAFLSRGETIDGSLAAYPFPAVGSLVALGIAIMLFRRKKNK